MQIYFYPFSEIKGLLHEISSVSRPYTIHAIPGRQILLYIPVHADTLLTG